MFVYANKILLIFLCLVTHMYYVQIYARITYVFVRMYACYVRTYINIPMYLRIYEVYSVFHYQWPLQ